MIISKLENNINPQKITIMLQLTTKWMTNTLAKKALQSGDFIECANNLRLYIVGFGELTSSAKNTYNYQVKDEQGTILASGENAYLDKLTTLVKGESPKTKERKEKSESAKVKTSYEIDFVTLQTKYESAKAKFEEFCAKYEIKTQDDARRKDEEQRQMKRQNHQTLRRGELTMLRRLQYLRKWAKETKRNTLLKSLNDKMLSIM